MKPDEIYLNHILNRCKNIQRIISPLTKEHFFQDQDSQDLVVRSLEIIGEATTHLSHEFKAAHSDILWRDIKNFRNIIIHQYFRIDLDFVWGTATEDIPILCKQIENVLKENFS